MTILIRQAHIIDPLSTFHKSTQDVFIENGRISKIGSLPDQQADKVIEANNLHLSPGWVDVFAHFCDPGFEFKETLETGIAAAAAGGFTEVLLLPNTNPIVTGKSQVEYMVQKAKNEVVSVHPLGAVTKQTEGKELAEMYDMKAAGAVAFTDGLHPVQSAGLLLKALQYVKAFEGTIIQIPDDKTIGTYGLMNEGIISTRLGLPGKPILAEEIQVARDIKLARYAESKLHFTGITSPKSIDYINRAKQSGAAISCSVTPAHLYFTDEDLQTYDTNLKLYPPVRTANERDALRQAVLNGGIDCITTHHEPHEYDSKVCEFEYAKPGMIGLETCYGVMGAVFADALSTERWVELVCSNPRKLMQLSQPVIKEGEPANVTIFDPMATYVFTEDAIRSKSKNSAFVGKELKGKVIGIINNNQLKLN
ncbi:dihydroorotase [Lacibacter luteus]|uniref:Dihydroorotase n=1 Tax=Lacibacter luteus TaxID=2508719 RepID=A0A4V1M7U7_9BACT|nr:dihydroorotase [Lacibacter luteus]RXK61592.1 dihydroorotase [Lacibacter luteus]